MEDNKDNKTNNKNDNDKEIVKKEDEILEQQNITREINLDELYDGAINNTVVIDPVTHDELLIETKKNNHKILGIVFAVLILLVLYFANNKLDIGNDKANVTPNATPKSTTNSSLKNGLLKCTYTSSSSSETQNALFNAQYEDDNIISSEFNYDVVLSSDNPSEIVTDLTTKYETFYLNNSAIKGFNITFEKDDKGFSFNSKFDYHNNDLDKMVVEDGQTILYAKPNSSDTLENLLNAYTNKGYNCVIAHNENN